MEKEQQVIQKKNKKRRNKNRLFLLLLLLLCTTVLFGTSTYAWFTANTTVTVDTLNVQVSTTGGISISATATDDWSVKINTEDIKGADKNGYDAAENQMPANLEPVSTTASKLTGGLMPMYYGHVVTDSNGTYLLTSADETAVTHGTTGKFISFDMFLRLDNTVTKNVNTTEDPDADPDAAQIYLRSGNVALTSTTATEGIQNAVRVAFVYENEDDNTKKYADLQALTAGTKTDNKNIYLWEPNATKHTPSAISQAKLQYGLTIGEENEVLSYYGLDSAFDESKNITMQQSATNFYTTNAAYFGEVTPTFTTTPAQQSSQLNQPLFAIKPGKVAKIKVYVWIEGQDVDCENDASGGNVNINMSFGIQENS